MKIKFNFKHFAIALAFCSVWINISEVIRYFAFVMPMTQRYFNNKPGIADWNLNIFLIWALWMLLLTASTVFISWLYASIFGFKFRSAIVAGSILWSSIFIIFWVATANMGLSTWNILWITLPLSLLEMIVGALITIIIYKRLNPTYE